MKHQSLVWNYAACAIFALIFFFFLKKRFYGVRVWVGMPYIILFMRLYLLFILISMRIVSLDTEDDLLGTQILRNILSCMEEVEF